jgi:hypothetical protein
MGDARWKRQRSGCTTGSSVLTPPVGLATVPDDADPLLDHVPGPHAVPRVDAVPDLPAPREPSPSNTKVWATACLCSHDRAAHEHWRAGSDCGACGAAGCPAYRRRGGRVRWILRRLRLVR